MLFTMRWCPDSTGTHMPLLQGPARSMDKGSGQRQNGMTGTGMDGEAEWRGVQEWRQLQNDGKDEDQARPQDNLRHHEQQQ